MRLVTLKVLPHNFAAAPPFVVDNGWRPKHVPILETIPVEADVIAAVIPGRGGMRVVVYNREDFAVTVRVDAEG
ncbi:MAG: hypothetical protein C7B45_16520 [Sulfobacillus acidophilus]|uniref:Uncharacterized protein n=1 Tax=Sulfobacillus acidophilus TaxID=53633 RepID=A0A2T2WCZ5_9FIRM|nr:MAG: hypothetical protein C7B45_16520 [Sulfobacillus acidophilus]